MSDLISRLKEAGKWRDAEACFTAADEIIRLRAELVECKLSLAAIHAMAHRVSAWTIQRECERAVPELAASAAKGSE